MGPFRIKGATQVIALSTSSSTTLLTNTSANNFLLQSSDVAGGGSIRIKFGTSTTTVSLSTTATSGVVMHGGIEGLIVDRTMLETHIAAIASTGTPNLFITPVQPL